MDGDKLREVILEKSAPGLRRRIGAAHQAFAHASLTDVEAEFEQFSVNARSTQVWGSPGTFGGLGLGSGGQPLPVRVVRVERSKSEQPRPLTMPACDGFGLHGTKLER